MEQAERVWSPAELLQYSGTDEAKPLLIALRGTVFDVSDGRSFYGPGGPYSVFAGRECGRALALMKIDVEECDNDSLEGLTEKQLKVLDDWFKKFSQKYKVMGKLVINVHGPAYKHVYQPS